MEQPSSLDMTNRSEAVREAHRQLRGYFCHNPYRTGYPGYLKNGWPIGSGVIESACKRVIALRSKVLGKHWREPNAIAHARSLYCSSDGRWT